MSDQVFNVPLTETRVLDILSKLGDVFGGSSRSLPDVRKAFAARISYTFLALVKDDFNEHGRGRAGDSGEKWLPLSAAYLAYQRPITGRGRPLAGGLWPGNRDSFMSKAQLAQWRRDFAAAFAWLAKKYPLDVAKGKAAAIATNKYKAAGGKVKISHPRFGGRKVGVDYQTLVDTGTLRISLTPGQLVGATYKKNSQEQIAEDRGTEIVVGTSVRYAKYHHQQQQGTGRVMPNRRFWPERLPTEWREELAEQVDATISYFVDQLKAGRL